MSSSTYVLTSNENTVVMYPYTLAQLMADNPNVSFPDQISDEIAADFNVYPVTDEPQPSYDYMTQNLNLINPSYQGGSWIQQWSVTQATSQEQAERLNNWRSGASCSPLQGKIELNNQGILDDAEAAVAASDKNTQLAWANAIIWNRTSPMIESLGTALGLSADDLDEMFKSAQQISV